MTVTLHKDAPTNAAIATLTNPATEFLPAAVISAITLHGADGVELAIDRISRDRRGFAGHRPTDRDHISPRIHDRRMLSYDSRPLAGTGRARGRLLPEG